MGAGGGKKKGDDEMDDIRGKFDSHPLVAKALEACKASADIDSALIADAESKVDELHAAAAANRKRMSQALRVARLKAELEALEADDQATKAVSAL